MTNLADFEGLLAELQEQTCDLTIQAHMSADAIESLSVALSALSKLVLSRLDALETATAMLSEEKPPAPEAIPRVTPASPPPAPANEGPATSAPAAAAAAATAAVATALAQAANAASSRDPSTGSF